MEGALFHGWSRIWQGARRQARRNQHRIAAPGGYSRGCSRRAGIAGGKNTRSCRSGSKPSARSCGILRRSRDRWRAKADALKRQVDELRAEMQRRAEQSPPAEPAVITPPDPAFELIPAGHQFCLVQVVLMLGWVLNGMTLRGWCSAAGMDGRDDVELGIRLPRSAFHNRALLAFAVGSLQPALSTCKNGRFSEVFCNLAPSSGVLGHGFSQKARVFDGFPC